jgi:hypothetical protein
MFLRSLLVLWMALIAFILQGQNSIVRRNDKSIRIAFYNLENFYDTFNDSLTLDDEFTPTGTKRWTYGRYAGKAERVYKTLAALGGWDLPSIVGFCEVENRVVLNRLIYETPLGEAGYRVIHKDSPDQRGMDVAVLYRADRFILLDQCWIRINFPFTGEKTRDILYAKGIVFGKYMLHLFINHWPSRFGGLAESQPRREFVAGILRCKIDSILNGNPSANILIMGDFNDEPDDISIAGVLGAAAPTGDTSLPRLVNISEHSHKPGDVGTIKYEGVWSVFDQVIVSGGLYMGRNGISVRDGKAFIFSPDFLLEPDKKYTGVKPFRTYEGPRYKGGFSDHLPVYLDLRVSGK